MKKYLFIALLFALSNCKKDDCKDYSVITQLYENNKLIESDTVITNMCQDMSGYQDIYYYQDNGKNYKWIKFIK